MAHVTNHIEINRMRKNIIVVLLLLIGINQVKSQDAGQIVIGTKHSTSVQYPK
jgi:hypothetical protein